MQGDLGAEPDLFRDFPSVLFDEGYGFKAGEGADEEMGICSIFAFVGIKYRNGDGLGFVFSIKVHGGQNVGNEDFSRVHVHGVRVFLRFLNTNWFADLSSSLCQNCWVLRVFICAWTCC